MTHAEVDLFPGDPFDTAEPAEKPKRRKSKGPTPNARSAKLMRERGYQLVQGVEQTIPHTFIKRDLYGIGDILCVGPDVVLVQATSDNGGNMAKRVQKIADSDATPILRTAGIRILVQGWRQRPDGTWHCREVDCS